MTDISMMRSIATPPPSSPSPAPRRLMDAVEVAVATGGKDGLSNVCQLYTAHFRMHAYPVCVISLWQYLMEDKAIL